MQERTPERRPRELVQDEGVEIVDFRFCDLPGLMQHFSIPAHELDRGRLRGRPRLRRLVDPRVPGDPGVGHAPDARPEHRGHRPVPQHTTLNINCFVRDPVTGESYTPRPALHRARRPRTTSSRTGIADTAYFGPEAEFFIFDSVRFDQNQYSGFYFLDSVEGVVELGRERARRRPEPRLQAAVQGGLLPGPADGPVPGPALRDGARRSSRSASTIEVQHHEVGTAGQAEIDMRFDTLLRRWPTS